MKKKLLFLIGVLLMVISTGCSNDEDKLELVDYYGTSVPYTPIKEKDLPGWLKEMKSQKSMMALKRIFLGTLNNELVYHLHLWTDSSIIGRFYDKDGNPIYVEGDFEDFIKQICNVRCIYIRSL